MRFLREKAVVGCGLAFVLVAAVACAPADDAGPDVAPTVTPTPTPTTTRTPIEHGETPVACSADGLDADVEAQDGLHEAVVEMRAEIAEAAVACDYERLDDLAGAAISYSFGEEGAFAEFLRREEADDKPLRYLRELLDRPYGEIDRAEGTEFVWPSAFAYDAWDDVPDDEREVLRPLYDEEDFAFFEQFGGYIGYRIGITEDGEWLFFIAGD